MRDILGTFDVMLYRLFDLELRLPQALRSPYRGAVVILGMLLGMRGKADGGRPSPAPVPARYTGCSIRWPARETSASGSDSR